MPKQGDRKNARVAKNFLVYTVPHPNDKKYVDYVLDSGTPFADFSAGQELILMWVTIGPPVPSWLVLAEVPETGQRFSVVITADTYKRLLDAGMVVEIK